MPQQRIKPVGDYTIKSLDQSLGVFEAFRGDREEISLGEIARIMNKSEADLAPLLENLVARGYLEYDGLTRVYRVGHQWFHLRNIYLELNTLRKVAREEMTTLMKQVHKSVYLARMDRATGQVIYVETAEAPESVVLISRIGNLAPVHCTASGKSMLAYLSPEERERILALSNFQPFTDKTITDRRTYEAHLDEVREKGYAVDDEEYYEGIHCAAAPVFNCLGEVVAAVGIAGYISDIRGDQVEKLAQKVKETALKISDRLGYRWENAGKGS